MGKIDIESYDTEDGKCPVAEFIDSLEPKMHAKVLRTINNYDQAIFDVITRGDDKLYYVSETGIFTIICVWIIAIIMFVRYMKRKGKTRSFYLI